MSIIEEIKSEMERSENKANDNGLLNIKMANTWVKEAKSRPNPHTWFHGLIVANENTVIFAASNVGKSILAVQIAEEIAKEEKVLYLDLELSDKQFQMRYTMGDTVHNFPDNFLRAEINPENLLNVDLENGIIDSIEKAIMTGVKVVIIDNITFACMNAERAEVAGEFMKKVIFLKQKYQLTVVAIAHTPKQYYRKTLDQYDLAGSSKLINLFDAGIAMGCSVKGKDLRYIKQVKTRSGPKLYGEDNVAVCELTTEEGWLHFKFLGCGTEREHLFIQKSMFADEEIIEMVRPLVKMRYPLSRIEKETGLSHGTAARVRKLIESEGDVPSVPSVPAVPNVPDVPTGPDGPNVSSVSSVSSVPSVQLVRPVQINSLDTSETNDTDSTAGTAGTFSMNGMCGMNGTLGTTGTVGTIDTEDVNHEA